MFLSSCRSRVGFCTCASCCVRPSCVRSFRRYVPRTSTARCSFLRPTARSIFSWQGCLRNSVLLWRRTSSALQGLCAPYPRSTTLGVSAGLSVTESSSSADPVIPTPLFPTSALVMGNVELASETAFVAEPEDLDGWTTVAVAQEGSGGFDGLSSAAEEKTRKPVVKDRSQVLLHHESSSCITVDHKRVDGLPSIAEDVVERVDGDGEQSEGLMRTHAVQKGSKNSSVVPALTRKRLQTKVAAKIEPGETENSSKRLDEFGHSKTSETRAQSHIRTSPRDLRTKNRAGLPSNLSLKGVPEGCRLMSKGSSRFRQIFLTLYCCIERWWLTVDFHRGSKLNSLLWQKALGEKHAKDVKTPADQFLRAGEMPPRRCKSRLQRTLCAGPSAWRDAEEKERARWVEILGSMLVHHSNAYGKNPQVNDRVGFSSWEPGGGRLRYVRGSARYAAV